MRKVFFMFLVGAFFNASAQITLTENDAPSIGDTVISVVDDNPASGLVPGDVGENVVWDFTSLGNTSMDTVYYVDPASVDINDEFPLANLAEIRADTSFLRVGSDGMALLGMIVAPLGTVKLDDPFYYITFPFTYGDNFCDTFQAVVTLPYDTTVGGVTIDSVRVTFSNIVRDTAVAYGTVKIPGETFDNALIIKSVSEKNQKVEVHTMFGWSEVSDTSYVIVSYGAYVNGYPGAVLTLVLDDDGTVESATYKYNEQANIEEPDVTERAVVFPNPAKDNLFIENKEGATIEIYDMSGNKVKVITKANKNTNINLGNFVGGTYIIKIKEDKVIKVGKINILK